MAPKDSAHRLGAAGVTRRALGDRRDLKPERWSGPTRAHGGRSWAEELSPIADVRSQELPLGGAQVAPILSGPPAAYSYAAVGRETGCSLSRVGLRLVEAVHNLVTTAANAGRPTV
jgi:hypothetical protein